MKRRAQPWLGTLVDIAIVDELDDAQFNAAFRLAFARVAEVHRLMSFHDRDSDVSRINRAAVGDIVEVHAWTVEVLRAALAMHEASGGIFDIACADRLVEWGYLPGDAATPSPSERSAPIAVEGETQVVKTAQGRIDLGGIAKGYAVDRALEALQEAGVASACINAGGDMRAFGETSYPVMIRDPAAPARMSKDMVLRDQALATSATYFSGKRLNGRDLSALVDGSSGQPIVKRISASVLAPCCMLADALTKIVAATDDPAHPILAQYGARAFII
jgi:thiamine biosynthesis lipoprotein